MDVIARTRPGLVLKSSSSRPQWARAAHEENTSWLELAVGPSAHAVYLIARDRAGAALDEAWHASLPEALADAERQFVLRPKDWVYAPKWQARAKNLAQLQ